MRLDYLNKGTECTNKMADAQAQHVQKFNLLAEDVSVGNGHLTPTLKLKRAKIARHHADSINKNVLSINQKNLRTLNPSQSSALCRAQIMPRQNTDESG